MYQYYSIHYMFMQGKCTNYYSINGIITNHYYRVYKE